jgi:hypothetical protein
MRVVKVRFSPACRYLTLAAILCNFAFAQTISYPDFRSSAGLKLLGAAASLKTADGMVIRLTKADCCLAGGAFTANSIPFQIPADTFSTFFQFRITDPGGIDPADGIVFVLRNSGSSALGGTGQSQGYDGIGQSIGIKFDTYRNDNEINDNHVAVQTNGTFLDEFTQTPYGVANCNKPKGVTGCMSNGDLWSVWIDYDGTTIHVALADGSAKRPADLVTASVSIPAILNYAAGAYVGFTAGTGGGFENHDIVNWQFSSTYNPTPVGVEQTMPPASLSQANSDRGTETARGH